MDTFDEQFINNQFKEKPMEPTYNKVQYSEFTPDRVGQWVLRGDTVEEVIELKNKVFGIARETERVATVQAIQRVTQAAVVAPTAQNVPSVSDRPQTQYVELTADQTITKYGLTDMVALQLKTPCKRCGSAQVYNPKTGKVFCKARCWTK